MKKFNALFESIVNEVVDPVLQKEIDRNIRAAIEKLAKKQEQHLDINTAIGVYLRRNDIKQSDFAAELAIHPSSLSKVLNGKFEFNTPYDLSTTNSKLKLGYYLVSAFYVDNAFIKFIDENNIKIKEFVNLPRDEHHKVIVHPDFQHAFSQLMAKRYS